jgi:hypothetical protein
VLREAGISPRRRTWSRPPSPDATARSPAYVAFTRRRLCLSVDREPEVRQLLARYPAPPRESVVLWWDI